MTIVVTGGKGGTGKTTVTAGLASCFAALGRRVVCVDADIGARNLDLALGMAGEIGMSTDFSDVLCERVPLEKALVPHPSIARLSLLPGLMTRRASDISAEAFRRMILQISFVCDIVLVDSCAGLEEGFFTAVNACETAVLVSTPDNAALRVAARAAELLGPEKNARLVLNRVRPKMIAAEYACNIDDFMDTTGLPLLGLIPEDDLIPVAMHTGVPLIVTGAKGAAGAMLRITRRLMGESIPLSRMKQWRVEV